MPASAKRPRIQLRVWPLLISAFALLSLMPFTSLAQERVAAEQEVPVSVISSADGCQATEGILWAEPLDLMQAEGEAPPAVFGREISLPWRGELNLASQTRWRVAVDVEGCWAAAKDLPMEAAAAALEFLLIPAGKLTGTLHSPTEASGPEEITLRFESTLEPPGEAEKRQVVVPRAMEHCSVTDARWTCVVPATTLDGRIVAEEFVPFYFWGAAVAPHEIVDLGSLDLEGGASLAGWIEWVDPPEDVKATQLTLARQRSGWQGDPRERKRLQDMSLSVSPTERGFFQFKGMAPGGYVLTAESPNASSVRLEVNFRRAEETFLDTPVALNPPATLEVFLDPPMTPAAQVWIVSLSRLEATSTLEVLRESASSPAGDWQGTGLQPGNHLLQISDAAGSTWVERWLEIAPGMRPVFIKIPLVEVAGTLSLGEEPFQATLTFGTTQGVEQIQMTAGEDGKFTGYLPHDGLWPVDLVFEDDQFINQTLEPVEVRKRPGQRVAHIEISLPGTRLSGEVVADGKPVPEARLAILRDGETKRRDAILLADEEGKFELRGMSPGMLLVQAYRDNLTSDWVQVDLQEGVDGFHLRLELDEKVEVSGLVRSPFGAVPSALVAAWPTMANGSFEFLARATTGVDGTFTLRLAKGTAYVDLVVIAPGFAHRLLRVPVSQDQAAPLMIEVESEVGTLVLSNPESDSPVLPTFTSVLHHGQAMIPVNLLLSILFPKRKVVPQAEGIGLLGMAPGEYRLCESAGTPCGGGVLAPAGELFLQTTRSSAPSVSRGESR